MRQPAHYALVQTASSAVVDILDTSPLELGRMQAACQRLILALVPLVIDHEPEPFQERQLARGRIVLLGLEGLDHAEQPHRGQLLQ